MEKQVINIPKHVQYLSEVMTELPKGIFNKVSTGCGGSTIAIESEHNYIMCVPSVNLVQNKVAQYPNERCDYNLLGVYGDITADQIKAYIMSNDVKKIIVTYDSLYKVAGVVKMSDYRVLVDEYQTILKSYSYRYKAINSMMETLADHPYVTYMTATPTEPYYNHPLLKNLPYTELKFEYNEKIHVTRRKTVNVKAEAVKIIEMYKTGGYPFEGTISNQAYFFVNSVQDAISIATSAKLKADEVNFCFSDNIINAEKLSIKKYKLGNTKDVDCTSKQFHFLTSCSFEGVDIYSDKGLCFILSDVKSKFTLLDVATDIVQISGRIRTKGNKLRSQLVHIYRTGQFDCTDEEWELSLNQMITSANNYVHDYSICSDDTRATLASQIRMCESSASNVGNPAFQLLSFNSNGGIFFDEYKVSNIKYTRELIHSIYRDGLRLHNAYQDAGKFEFNGNQENYSKAEYTNIAIELADKRPRFDNLCRRYIELRQIQEPSEAEKRERQLIEYSKPNIQTGYELLGASKLGTLKYYEAAIIEAIKSDKVEAAGGVKGELKRKLRAGKRYTNKELKELFKAIYNVLGIKKTAKASDIEEYAVCDQYKSNGERGYEIIGFRPDPKPESETPISASADNQPVIKVEQYSLLNHPAFKACERRQE
jgi:hypothetical protein